MFDSFIVEPIQKVMTIFYQLTKQMGMPNYGIAIILLTIVIKIVLYPLTVKQVKSMKAVQDLQPKVKAIQDKYKDNKEKVQAEIASLYRETGVNPLAGCLPLIIQMPILIGLFFAIKDFRAFAEVNEATKAFYFKTVGEATLGPTNFLWLKDLFQNSDNLSFTNPSDPFFIIPILCAATTYIQQKQTTTEMTQQNKMMLIFMPAFIGYITVTFPAGLGLYWVVSNLAQILQQWWMYRKPSKA